ncbi:rod shape-determining protein MreC [Candidatus Formimonas warabiya]|uniref:Cell shape-determining protein MreC n=1 Tax=Formimonas warabiya TaxID=1761012 RepID=A0A3G1L1B2_FORW1|nr:rod shape-determining protein MreC [Candidatus Formimonas warabiya]
MVLPRLWKRGKWLLLLVAVFVILSIARYSGMERNNLTFLEIWVRDLLAPLESGATAVLGGTKTVTGYFTGYHRLLEERQEQEKEIARLKNEVNSLTEAQLENARLRELLGMRESMEKDWEMVPAKIIARDASNWYHSVILDRGTDDGLAKDMVVINNDGLVGKIISVTRNTAEVLLILDREGALGCVVQLSRTPGIIEGTGSQGMLRMVHFPHDADIEENQVVLTSGLGGVFPAGLRIGFVTEVKVEPNGLMKQATVQPFVDFDRLEEVLVLIKPTNEVHVP